MHQAFWDYLESQLNEDPPSYINAIKMLSDIKEVRNKSKRYSLQSDKPSSCTMDQSYDRMFIRI